MENQYFTSELMARALGARLAEPGGPDVVLVSTTRSPSYFDQNTMDPTRSRFIEKLKAADLFGRFQIYSPVTALGRDIIVHAKVTIIDDVLVRVGSANMNNRSFAFDTECDLSLEADGARAESQRAAIGGLRTDILAHWLGCAGAVVDDAIAREGGVCRALESLREAGFHRLRPIAPQRLHPPAALIAEWHIGDPMSPADSFRPWKRRRAIERECRAAGL
jgi:phosphatidylserine/phosphatidylglycerophosphate/cardiolipin synthase-like enzyme